MKLALLLFTVLLFVKDTDQAVLDKQEARNAFELLNKIRQDPALYAEELSFSASIIQPRSKLIWNDTLAKVAERKAMDMAKRAYFAHVDPDGKGINYYINKEGYTLDKRWLSKPQNNFFESIHAGSETGEEAIKNLIIDKNVPSLGHRNHLLGINEWNSSLTDIGIGFVKSNGKYRSYMSVVIAKHK